MGNTGAGIVFVCTLIACGAFASAPGLGSAICAVKGKPNPLLNMFRKGKRHELLWR